MEAVKKYQTILTNGPTSILPNMSTDDIESFLVKAVEKETVSTVSVPGFMSCMHSGV